MKHENPGLARLQVLRLAAAALVVFGHARLDLQSGPGELLPFLNSNYFAAGVDIFFVLSGFIMYRVSHASFGVAGPLTEFARRRLMRIVPAYWICSTAMIGWHVLASYLFFPVLNPYGQPYPVLILGWTLNFEMLFYAVYALGLAIPRRAGLTLVFGSIGALAAWGLVSGPSKLPWAFWANSIVLEFLFGIVLARAHVAGWRCSIHTCMGPAALGIVLLYAGSQWSGPGSFWPWRLLFMGCPAVLICASMALAAGPMRDGPVQRALVFGGDASYALYLTHPFTQALLDMAFGRLPSVHPWARMALVLPTCLPGGLVFYALIERPTQAWLQRRRFLARPPSTAEAQA